MSTWKERKKKGQPRDFGKPQPESTNVGTIEAMREGLSILKAFIRFKKWLKLKGGAIWKWLAGGNCS